MENDYNFKKEYDKNILFELNQISRIIIHSCLIGSIITFIAGVLLYLI